jgi:hypothetical protein
MKYIITEKQFKKISDLVLKEQATTQTTTLQTTKQPNLPVVIENVTYRLPKIKNEQDLSNFVAELNADQLVNIVGKGRMYLYPLTTGAKIPAQMRGSILLRSLSEFLRVHAITGNVNPMDLATLKSTIDKLSTVPTMKGLFVYSPAFLEMLLTPTSYIAGDVKNITTYYQNLLKQRLS